MKTFIVIMLSLAANVALADEYVHGYTRNDGTPVQSYHRSNPDSSTYNNYSTQGNVNPYTVAAGHENPNQGMGGNSNYSNPYQQSYPQPNYGYGNR